MCTLIDYSLDGIEKFLSELLGDDPAELRSENYLKALNGIGIEGIRKFIFSLLENGIPSQVIENSYFHPNKFFKLGICRLPNKVKLRLHFWNKNQLEVQTPIHFHAWDFASLLIAGSYVHDIFDVKDLDAHILNEIEKYKNGSEISCPTFMDCFGMYKIPKRDGVLGKFKPEWVKYVRAIKRSSKYEQQGSSYFLDMQFPHQITIDLKDVGSMITLVITSETNINNMYTFQPITQTKTFDNPSPNVDEIVVREQLEAILYEINALYGVML